MLKNLKSLRKEYGISQQRLADAVFVTQTSINKYKNHNTETEIEILMRLADYFDTTIDYLVGYSDQRYKAEHLTEERLTPREARLLADLRALPEEKQHCVEQVTANRNSGCLASQSLPPMGKVARRKAGRMRSPPHVTPRASVPIDVA